MKAEKEEMRECIKGLERRVEKLGEAGGDWRDWI